MTSRIDGWSAKQHDEPIDADALAGRGRHAVLEGPHVVLVEPVGLVVAAGPRRRLLHEALALVDGIVQLACRRWPARGGR